MRVQGVVLVLAAALLAAGGARSTESVTDRLRASLERRARLDPKPRRLEDVLQRVVDADPDFDPDAGTKLAGPMRATYAGLQYLLNDALRDQFLGLSSDSLRQEWLRRYWLLRDPTPTTPENERLIEHERRVRFAREQFFMAMPPHWDDRGAFLIQCGPPDGMNRVPADVREGIGYVPETLYWYYADGGMIVPFEQRPPGGPWCFGSSAKTFSSRAGVARAAFSGMRDFFNGYGLPATAYDTDLPTPAEVDPMNAANVAVSMAAARDVLENKRERFFFPGMPVQFVWFVFDTDAFRREVDVPSGSLRVEAHVQFVIRDLAFQWQDSLYVARYRIEGVLFDADLHETARDAYEADLTARSYDTTQRANLYPGQLRFDVDPGTYRMAIRLVDLRTGNQGSYTADVNVPERLHRPLAVSDIELATAILPAVDFGGSRFAKHDRLVMPNPIGVYKQRESLTAYFEIYGLRLDAQGVGRYRLSYQILPAQADASRRPKPHANVTASFVAEAHAADSIEELRIDIAALREAAYELVVQVQDLSDGGGETESRTRFSVLRED